MTFPPDLLVDLGRRAEADHPYECCGALLGHGPSAVSRQPSAVSHQLSGESGEPATRVVRIVPCANAAEDPASRYTIAPEELLALHRDARREGLEVVGYYHSHPSGDGVPSAIDRAESWPDLAYVIIPVKDGAALAPRCWRFTAEGPLEEPIFTAELDRSSTGLGESS